MDSSSSDTLIGASLVVGRYFNSHNSDMIVDIFVFIRAIEIPALSEVPFK
jgi:hypothetical protein